MKAKAVSNGGDLLLLYAPILIFCLLHSNLVPYRPPPTVAGRGSCRAEGSVTIAAPRRVLYHQVLPLAPSPRERALRDSKGTPPSIICSFFLARTTKKLNVYVSFPGRRTACGRQIFRAILFFFVPVTLLQDGTLEATLPILEQKRELKKFITSVSVLLASDTNLSVRLTCTPTYSPRRRVAIAGSSRIAETASSNHG